MPKRFRIALIIEALLLCAVYLGFWSIGGTAQGYGEMSYHPLFAHWMEPSQYGYLADALLDGRTDLDLPVSPSLAALEDPYDFEARYEIGSTTDEKIFWDHAFYQGRYYSYFGVVPAIVVFAPFRLVTGTMLNTSYAVAFLGVCAILASAFLVASVVRRYFGDTVSMPSILIAELMLFGGSNVMYLGMVPTTYSVPILCSLTFTFLGLGLWMRAGAPGAEHEDTLFNEADFRGTGRLDVSAEKEPRIPNAACLFAGSFFMALNLGCRPQFILACFLAIPMFWREITQDRTLFSARGIVATLCALVPFAIVFAPLLWYNWIRFGSVADFGSNYNLTGFNMTTYVQSPYCTLILLFSYIFTPVFFESSFPFVASVDYVTMVSKLFDLSTAWYFIPVLIVGVWAVVLVVRGIAGLMERRRVLGIASALALVAGVLGLGYLVVRAVLAGSGAGLIGWAPNEPMFGGYIWLVPQALVLLVLPRAYHMLCDKRLWSVSVLSLLFAATVLFVDTRIAGITQRYFSDFGWYLMLIVIFVLFALQAQEFEAPAALVAQGSHMRIDIEAAYREERDRAGIPYAPLAVFCVVAIVISAGIGFLSFFSPAHYGSIAIYAPAVYAAVAGSIPA